MITGINSCGLKPGKNCNETNKDAISTMSSKPENGEVDLYCRLGRRPSQTKPLGAHV